MTDGLADGGPDKDPEDVLDVEKARKDGADVFNDAKKRRELLDKLRGTIAGSGKRNATYAVAPTLAAAKAMATFDVAGVSQGHGDPAVVGKLLIALERFLDAVGADVLLSGLSFVSSVTFELEPRISTQERAVLDEVLAMGPRVPRDVAARALPASVVALEACAHLLNQPPEKVVDRVRVVGGAHAREELRKLADTVEKVNGSMHFVSAVHTEAELTKRRAHWYVRRLTTPQSEKPVDIVVRGQLTRTDSDAREFRVLLDRKHMPEELDARRRYVEGSYTADARRQVEDNGLWNHQVVADVRASMERPAGGGKPRPSDFTFRSVRASAG